MKTEEDYIQENCRLRWELAELNDKLKAQEILIETWIKIANERTTRQTS